MSQSSSTSESLAHPLSYVSRISPSPFTMVSRSSIEIIRLATDSRDLMRCPVLDDVVRAARTRTPSFVLAVGNRVLGKVSRVGNRRGVWKLQKIQLARYTGCIGVYTIAYLWSMGWELYRRSFRRRPISISSMEEDSLRLCCSGVTPRVTWTWL